MRWGARTDSPPTVRIRLERLRPGPRAAGREGEGEGGAVLGRTGSQAARLLPTAAWGRWHDPSHRAGESGLFWESVAAPGAPGVSMNTSRCVVTAVLTAV